MPGLHRCARLAWAVFRTPHRGLVERWIARRIGGAIRISELAALCGLSLSSFQRAFRTSFGMSAHAYITAQRIAEAKRLLRNTDWAISEVAAACGFSGQAHLTTVFRLHTGTTPARHRHAL